jgi:hypothetical protein
MKISELTPYEVAKLRLYCVKAFVEICSKHDLEKKEIFVHAESAFNFIVKGLENISEKHAEKPSLEKKAQPSR